MRGLWRWTEASLPEWAEVQDSRNHCATALA